MLVGVGENWEQVQERAFLIDGKAWKGQAIKSAVLPHSVILPVVLIAVNYKATSSLVKALGLTD